MLAMQGLFENIACPLCEFREFDIVRASLYPEAITVEQLGHLYRASSDHILLDQVVQCRNCALQYVNPRLDSQFIISAYAEGEDPAFVSQNKERIRTFGKTIHSVLRRLGEAEGKGKRLLDVGCAGGALLVAARDAGFDAVGVEPSRWLAEYGRRTYNVDIRDGSLQAGMFPDSSFDIVTLWDVIEHVPDPHELLRLIHTLLKPGGLLLVNYPDVGSTAARVLGRRWPFWLSVHVLYYDRRTIARQLARAGFERLWYQPCFQTLTLGYVVRRATAYAGILKFLQPVIDSAGLSKLPFTYNMGQTLVVCRRNDGST